MSTDPRTPGGATSIGGPDAGARRKKPWWLLLVLALLVVAVLLLLSQCGNSGNARDDADDTTPSTVSTQSDDPATGSETSTATDGSASTSAPGSASATASGSSAASATGAATSNLTVDGAALLPLTASAPDGSLAAYAGQAVQARGVTVLSVPADEGFWVGTSRTDQVWVQLSAGGESPYQVTEGDIVDLNGTMAAHDASFADQVGVTADEGAEQLTAQGQHVEVARDAVTLTK